MTPLQAYLKDVMDAEEKRTQGEWTARYFSCWDGESFEIHTPPKHSPSFIRFDRGEDMDFVVAVTKKLRTTAKLAEAFEAALIRIADPDDDDGIADLQIAARESLALRDKLTGGGE